MKILHNVKPNKVHLLRDGKLSNMSLDEWIRLIGAEDWSEQISIQDSLLRKYHQACKKILAKTQYPIIDTQYLEKIAEDTLTAFENTAFLGRREEGLGFDVVAIKDIPAQSVIAVYSGECYETIQKPSSLYGISIDTIDINMAYSADNKRCLASMLPHLPSEDCKFLNPADDSRVAFKNLDKRRVVYYENGNPFIIIIMYAIKDIKKGEIMGHDYGLSYWLALNKEPHFFEKDGTIISPAPPLRNVRVDIQSGVSHYDSFVLARERFANLKAHEKFVLHNSDGEIYTTGSVMRAEFERNPLSNAIAVNGYRTESKSVTCGSLKTNTGDEIPMIKKKDNTRLENALDPDYWARLNPELSVCKRSASNVKDGLAYKLSLKQMQDIAENLKSKGWDQIDSFFSKPTCDSLADAVLTLEKSDWLPIFCFVYDEFWELTRSPQIKELLALCLGPKYQQKSAAWAHLVHTRPDAHGWSPHIDISPKEGSPINEDGSPRFLSVWVPLTNATLDNGCMYLLPADRMDSLGLQGDSNDLIQMLHATQAIPMQAGSIGLWRQDIVHWGSYSSKKAKGPRISIALEFQSFAKKNPIHSIFDGTEIPATLEERLFFISHQISLYLSKWEPKRFSNEYILLAEELQKNL